MAYDLVRRAISAHGLKTARVKARLSASEAAKLIGEVGISCSRATLLAWERGAGPTTREPFASDLSVLALIYGCTVVDFYEPRDANSASHLLTASKAG